MSFRLVVTVSVVTAIAFYVTINNPSNINFHINSDLSYNLPLVMVVLGSIFIGAILVAFMDVIGISCRGIVGYRARVKDRKSQKRRLPYSRGLRFMNAGFCKEAEEEFEKVLEKDPRHLPSLIELGKLKMIGGEHQEALKLHNRALALDEENLEAAFSLADDYTRLKRYRKAHKILEAARKITGDDIVILTSLRKVCIAGRMWDDALKVQRGISAYYKNDDQSEKERAILHGIQFEMGQEAFRYGRFEDAVKELKTVLKSERNFTPAYAVLGDVYLAADKEADAVKVWREGYRVTSSPLLLQKQEALFMSKEDPGSAISLYKNALSSKPDEAGLNYLLGLVYLKLEMMEEALEQFTRVQRAGAVLLGIGSKTAEIYEKTGRKELAAIEYRKEIERIEGAQTLFKCVSCGASDQEWNSRCSNCGGWNVIRMNLESAGLPDEKASAFPAPPLRLGV